MKIDRSQILLFLLFIPVAFGSYLFHEFGHWSVGELLGNNMSYSLNFVSVKSGNFLKPWHEVLVAVGGPAVNILVGSIFLLIIEKSRNIFLYPVVFFQFFVRFFSIVFGGFDKQDEAGISRLLGIGKYTTAIIVLTILLFFAVRASKTLKINLEKNGYFFAMSTISILLVIASYKFV